MKSAINIPQLYKLKRSDREKLALLYLDAFAQYPKLMKTFKDRTARLLALEATIRYYTAYDMKYGSGFSLDENIHEAVMLVHSDNMKYTFFRHLAAGSYNRGYRDAVRRLSADENRIRTALFDELDRLEETIDIPVSHIYADFQRTPASGTRPQAHVSCVPVCRQRRPPDHAVYEYGRRYTVLPQPRIRYHRRDNFGNIRFHEHLYALRSRFPLIY